MMKRLAIAASWFVLTSTAAADRRLFTYTYEYSTVPQGSTALQLWHTEDRSTWEPDSAHSMENRFEIEHGLSDHWDAGLLSVFGQTASNSPGLAPQPYSFKQIKLETRYRFADRGEWPVDVLAYGELIKWFGEGIYELEGRAVAARNFDSVTAAVNVFGVAVFDPKPRGVFGYAGALSYELHPKFSLGAEAHGERNDGAWSHAAGPAASLAPAANLWVAFTLGLGLNDAAPALAGRFIVAVEL
jgi:hypothetical protein